MTDHIDRILAKGVPVTLIDGSETTIRFGMLGTRMLTKKYGSLNRLQRAMNEQLGVAAESEQEKDITDEAMDLLLTLRAAGLSHLGMDEAELDNALGLYGLMAQMSMIFEAFSEGLGEDSPANAAGPKDHMAKGGTLRSPSQNSGPSAPLRAAAPMQSSGT